MSDKKRLLDLQDVSIVFGGLRAVSNLTMHIDEGELVGLIGPNGAGKTTAFNMITGVYLPTEGQIYLWAWPEPSRTSVCSPSCRYWTT